MQGIFELDIVSESGVGHGTPVCVALLDRSNYRRDSQSTVAGPSNCASVALRRRLRRGSICFQASNYCARLGERSPFMSVKIRKGEGACMFRVAFKLESLTS